MESDSFISSKTWSKPASVQVQTISTGFHPAVDAVPYPPESDIWQRSSPNENILNDYIGQNNSSKSIKRFPK